MDGEAEWRTELDRWLEPFLRPEQRGATGDVPALLRWSNRAGQVQSMQPMAARHDGLSYDLLHHFISVGRWDVVAETHQAEVDRMVDERDAVLAIDDKILP